MYAHLLREAGCKYTGHITRLRNIQRAFLMPFPSRLAFRLTKTGTGVAKELRNHDVLSEHIYNNERMGVPPARWPQAVLRAMQTNKPPSPYEFACFFFGRKHRHAMSGADKRSYLAYFLLGVPISAMAEATGQHRTLVVKHMADAVANLRQRSLAFTFFMLPIDPTPAFSSPHIRAALRYVWDPVNAPDPGLFYNKDTTRKILQHPYIRAHNERGYVAKPTIRPWAPPLTVWPNFKEKKKCLKVLSPRQCRDVVNNKYRIINSKDPIPNMVRYGNLKKLFLRYNAGEPPPNQDTQSHYVWK